jgi:hypothetical protein
MASAVDMGSALLELLAYNDERFLFCITLESLKLMIPSETIKPIRHCLIAKVVRKMGARAMHISVPVQRQLELSL